MISYHYLDELYITFHQGILLPNKNGLWCPSQALLFNVNSPKDTARNPSVDGSLSPIHKIRCTCGDATCQQNTIRKTLQVGFYMGSGREGYLTATI